MPMPFKEQSSLNQGDYIISQVKSQKPSKQHPVTTYLSNTAQQIFSRDLQHNTEQSYIYNIIKKGNNHMFIHTNIHLFMHIYTYTIHLDIHTCIHTTHHKLIYIHIGIHTSHPSYNHPHQHTHHLQRRGTHIRHVPTRFHTYINSFKHKHTYILIIHTILEVT